jgi:uncharacterized protein
MATFHGEPYELRGLGTRGPRRGLVIILISALLLIIGARAIAGTIIDFEWWKEMGQVETWTSLIVYGTLPVLAAGLLLFAVLWIAHARGMKSAGTALGRHPTYAKVATLGLLLLSLLLGRGAIDSWTIVRYVGSRGVAESVSWADPIFGHPLRFYLFDLPFYRDLLALLLVLAATALLVHWLTARVWGLSGDIDRLRQGEVQLRLQDLLEDALRSNFARIAAVVFLAGLAAHFYLARYELLYSEHGFLTGMDWVDAHVRLPIQWLLIVTCLVSAAFVLAGRWMWIGLIVVVLFLRAVVPAAVAGLYVRPNELVLEKPYIEHHLAATRNGFGLETKVREVQYPARIDAPIEVSTHRQLFENVRLWDWRAFHDTMSQIQALRQYFVFPDIDVDRYTVEGRQRQMLLAPREIDIRQLAGQQQNSWINTHLIYTHGYGLVMASAAHIGADGQPVLYIQDAPPKVNLPGAKLTRPELYYGESMHEPVFVRTGQPEFNYPAGAENVHTRYDGKAGIPVSSLFTKLVATVARGDWNIMLTGYLNDESRMLIRRNVRDRVDALADFLGWDPDPYIVLTDAGRLVWMIDGYTMSDAHPYSRRVQLADLGVANYMRNSVKATVDAYDGTVNLYVFDDADPIIKAWRSIFPKLFKNASEMPADLRAHVRYPQQYFEAQAEIYRTFHIHDPENFYNKEDQWDLAKGNYGQSSSPEPVQPTFIIATLPGESKAEFLLVTSFTPRGKDNMIALMAARCDGAHFGELVVLQLSKQALIYGPLQIQARIDSDANISKDLTLWNQQGSQVLRGTLLVLPVEDTFLYVEPIYMQAAQAKIPQLKKVVLATGNRIIYRDTYEQAVNELTGESMSAAPVPAPATAGPAAPAAPAAAPPNPGDKRLEAVREHMRRYREFSAQGKWSEAGKELEAIESLLH